MFKIVSIWIKIENKETFIKWKKEIQNLKDNQRDEDEMSSIKMLQ